LGRSLDQALVTGSFKVPSGFKTSRENPNIPAFMQAYFKLVFDKHGLLLSGAPAEAIRHLRQVFYFAYKLEIPFSSRDEARVIDNFISVDKDLNACYSPLAVEIISLAKTITWKVFHDFDHKDIRPRHGPGAVATGERLEQKWKFSRLYKSIHQVYPYYHYYVVGGARELTDRLEWYRSLVRLETGSAKVVLVPKDSRGPRLISCEPLEFQWIQQGLGRKMARHLEYGSPYTRFRVNFEHQEINRNLAKISSTNQRYATLDLKDASDRVSLELVRNIFANVPALSRALEACRTTETLLPNGIKLPLKKFAPMGSALCFPVEAYIFWAVIVSAVIIAKKLPLEKVGRRVYVYGDDIVVPTDWASLSIQALESVGLMVNKDKSCLTGYFRESCGMDAFKGIDVTPVRLKTQWSSQKRNGSILQSYASIANSFDNGPYRSVCDLIRYEIERHYGVLPYGVSRSSYPCRIVADPLQAETLNKSLFRWRVNRNYQRIEFLLPSLSFRRKLTKLDGWLRLLRNNVAPPVGDPSRVVLPLSMLVKRGWTSVA
jgi:hypothetical protein